MLKDRLHITTDALLAMAKPGQKPQCLALMTVHPNTSVTVGQLLGNAPVCQRSLARVHATRIVLQSLWSKSPFSQNVHFWCDLR